MNLFFGAKANNVLQLVREMLTEAESMFGERDKTWTFLGVEFKPNGPSIIYYPNNQVSICLSDSVAEINPYNQQFIFQLSHEVCHLLFPTGRTVANNLEEGLATWFSKFFTDKFDSDKNYAINSIKNSNYYDVYLLAENLIKEDIEAIKKMRQLNNTISDLTEKEIRSLNLNLSDFVITEMITPFQGSRPTI